VVLLNIIVYFKKFRFFSLVAKIHFFFKKNSFFWFYLICVVCLFFQIYLKFRKIETNLICEGSFKGSYPYFYRRFDDLKKAIFDFFENIRDCKAELQISISWNFYIPENKPSNLILSFISSAIYIVLVFYFLPLKIKFFITFLFYQKNKFPQKNFLFF
jgi:hypothetical protein